MPGENREERKVKYRGCEEIGRRERLKFRWCEGSKGEMERCYKECRLVFVSDLVPLMDRRPKSLKGYGFTARSTMTAIAV